jgi:hypothetical protein
MEMRGDVRVYSGIFIVILAALAVIIFFIAKTKPQKPISNFEQCVAAGYPVMQSYPPQCTLPNGKFFVQKIVPQQ